MIKEAGGDAPPKEYADLSEEQATELQEIYSEIVKNYHPQTHPDLTEAHKELFKKAQEAYRRKDVSALKLIYDMLTSADGEGIDIELLMSMLDVSVSAGDDGSADERFTTDYTLVANLYKNFVPTTDLFLYDIKCISEDMHIEYTGTTNKLILEKLWKNG